LNKGRNQVAIVEYNGTPIMLYAFPGSGVHDLFVRVPMRYLQRAGFTPTECFELTGSQVTYHEGCGFGVLSEAKRETEEPGSALLLRLVVDTRYAGPRMVSGSVCPVAVRFPFSEQYAAVLAAMAEEPEIQAAASAGTPYTLISCPASSVPDELEQLPHVPILPGRADSRAYFVLLNTAEKPADLPARVDPMVHPGQALEVLHLRGHPGGAGTDLPFIPVGLALDLGNTRSFALVIDDLQGRQGETDWLVHRLNMVNYVNWNGHDLSSSARAGTGVFDSFLALSMPRRFDSDVVETLNGSELVDCDQYGCPMSFLRMGENALPFHRVLMSEPTPGRYALSSPKRYFWEDDPEWLGWKAFTPRRGSRGTVVGTGAPLDSTVPLVRWLLANDGGGDEKLSRSAILSATVVELMEQAEGMMNSPASLDHSNLPFPRRIASVCVTFPPSWSTEEIRVYTGKLRRGLEALCTLRALPMPDLYVSCDEASAALLGFVFSEIRKFGGMTSGWLSLVGRSGDERNPYPCVRIGIIDIGGGTSDLVISEITDTEGGGGVSLELQRLHRDGVNTAGDELLRQLLEELVMPEVGRVFFTNEDAWKRVFNRLLVAPAPDDETREWRRRWAREIWFPLAIRAIQALETGESTVDFGELAQGIRVFGDHLWEVAGEEGCRNAFVRGTREGITTMELPDHARHVLKRVCDSIFHHIARRFATSVFAFDCDLVLLAGKTSEISFVRDLFRSETPIAQSKFVALQGYRTGRWCPLADARGMIADAKVTTVLGATVYLMAEAGAPALGANMRVSIKDAPIMAEDRHYWGRVSAQNLRFRNGADLLFGPGSPDTKVITLNTMSLLIGRRPFEWEAQEAQIAYELRVRPQFRAYGSPGGAKVTLVREYDQAHVILRVRDVEGAFSNGTPVELKHIELRHRILFAEGFWVDEGVIASKAFR
jgi:hypothetical protein